MQARSNTSIIIVPGSFSPAFFYNDMVSNLKDAGLEAAVYDLPSANRKTPQEAASLVDDAEFFHQKASALTKQGKQVVLVAHSYGGLVASQCVEGLSKAERPGQAGFVQRIIYLTSVIPRLGQSLQSLMGTLLPEFIKIDVSFEVGCDDLTDASTRAISCTMNQMALPRSISLICHQKKLRD